jgi:hypothetical protein
MLLVVCDEGTDIALKQQRWGCKLEHVPPWHSPSLSTASHSVCTWLNKPDLVQHHHVIHRYMGLCMLPLKVDTVAHSPGIVQPIGQVCLVG